MEIDKFFTDRDRQQPRGRFGLPVIHPIMPGGPMASIHTHSGGRVFSERIDTIARQPKAISCALANRSRVLLPLLLANRIAVGDEITYPIPAEDGVGMEVFVKKVSSAGTGACIYLASIEHATQPKLDKRDRVLFPRRFGVAAWASRPSFYP